MNEQKEGQQIMRYLPDGEQMKKADEHTIREIGIPSPVLMERAALQTVAVMRDRAVDLSRPLIVCGSGNNGGDGFAVARILCEEGESPVIFFAGSEASLSGECRLQMEIVRNMGINIRTEIPEGEYTVIVDALFGVGLSREISGRYREAIEWMNAQKCRKVSVDIPSGVCARTGRVLGTAFHADLTVSMACVKAGCEWFPGKNYAGETVAVPIGIDAAYFADDPAVCVAYDPDDLSRLLPERKPDSHKGSYGRVLMITGSSGMAGAAYLSARAAYSVGAGLVQIYTHEDNRMILQQLLPEAIISCYADYDEERLKELLDWADVVCIGCGLGLTDTAERTLAYTLRYEGRGCIVDADGLNLLSRHMELFEDVKMPLILTPHMKEMSRLTGRSVGDIKERRMDILKEYADRYPAVWVLKDSRTAVYRQGRHPVVSLAGNSAMAKGGSGDVLAGVITGLLAQGMTDYESAALGVYLHACGGDAARKEKGSYSVLARDLIRGIETVIKSAEEKEYERA